MALQLSYIFSAKLRAGIREAGIAPGIPFLGSIPFLPLRERICLHTYFIVLCFGHVDFNRYDQSIRR